MAKRSLSTIGTRGPSHPLHRRAVTRMLVAGVFLLLELPLLLPVIAGAGLMALVVGVRAVARRLSPGEG